MRLCVELQGCQENKLKRRDYFCLHISQCGVGGAASVVTSWKGNMVYKRGPEVPGSKVCLRCGILQLRIPGRL